VTKITASSRVMPLVAKQKSKKLSLRTEATAGHKSASSWH